MLRYHGQTGAYIDDFIPPNSSPLDYPVALIFRGTNLFVSSQLNDRVLRYNANTGAYLDMFIAPSTNLIGPSDMQFGRDGNLYVVGRSNNRVVRYNGQTGAFIDIFINSNLSQPFGLRFLPDAVLLVASGNENSIKAFNASGDYFRTLINTGNLNFPIGFLVGIDEIITTSYNNDKLARFNLNTGVHLGDISAPGLNGPNFMIFRPSPRPALSITLIDDEIRLTWPEAPSPHFRLYDSDTPDFAALNPFPALPLENGTNTISIPVGENERYYRLEKPY